MAGPSMLPTLDNSGELVVESILPYRLFPNHLARGELITLTSPVNPSRIICKRVLGLPGDIICVDPTGIKAPSTEHVVVPKGHIWIVGDNASWSRDSRDYGPVSMALIRGRIAARVSALNFAVCHTRTHIIIDLSIQPVHHLLQGCNLYRIATRDNINLHLRHDTVINCFLIQCDVMR